MPKHGKRYRDLYAKVDRERDYTPAEAVQLVKSLQSTKATETIEIHVRTGLNVRHADEQLRGTITLPNSEGRDVTVAVFARASTYALPCLAISRSPPRPSSAPCRR